jgi:hypothetical protein
VTARYLLLGAACAAALAGCSSSSASLNARAPLHADVLALSQAAAAQDWSGAQAALSRLRADLDAAVAAGQVSSGQASAIRADASAVAADVTAQQHPATPTPSHTPSPPPKPKPKDSHGHGGDGGGGGDGGD